MLSSPALGPPVLSVEGVTAGYAGAPVIRDLRLVVRAGEVVALVGANGAGKTTTLRAISGLVRPISGRVLYQGVDLGRTSAGARTRSGIVHVPEGRGIFYGLTVADHFRVFRGPAPLDEADAYARFPALEPLKKRRAGLLSGGEQQMLALALALARRPKVLLLDELSLGLAPVIVERLLPAIRDYAAEARAAVLLVEQHVYLALDIADRLYALSHGSLVLDEDAAAVRSDRRLLLRSYLGEA